MRIIAGSAKGHTLKSPKGFDTRPTQDRIRESIANVLTNYGFYGAAVLDLFSGTGAMALESLSRGAATAVCVDRATARVIADNADHTKLREKVEILPMSLSAVVPRLSGRRFDYIFADPPYRNGLLQPTVDAVVSSEWLTESGICILERHEEETCVWPDDYEAFKSQRFGYTRIDYVRRRLFERGHE